MVGPFPAVSSADSPNQMTDRSRLIVKGLPESAGVHEIETCFEVFGPVIRVRILENESTGKRKGSAVIQFREKESGIEAWRSFQFCMCGEEPLDVMYLDPARDLRASSTLMISNLPERLTKGDLRELFRVFGQIASVHVPEGKGGGRGWGQVRFYREADAEEALGMMDGIMFGSVVLQVELAQLNDF